MVTTVKFELLEKVNNLFTTLNPRQQSIGREIIIDPNLKIYEESEILLVKDVKGGQVYRLQDFIKAKCNCD